MALPAPRGSIETPAGPRFDQEAWAAWLQDWCRATAPDGAWFDRETAARACAFFPHYLRHTKGIWAGEPFELQLWQRAVVACLFGWKRADGSRRFRQALMLLPRKNGKTELAAGIGLELLFVDGEPAAEIYSVANETEQAAICFNAAKRMRQRSAELASRSLAHKRSLLVGSTMSSWVVLSSNAGTKDGLSAHGVIYDEVHAFTDRSLFDVMHTSMGARRQPLELFTTTEGVEDESFFTELLEYAERVEAGEIADPGLLPVLFRAEPDADWMSPAVWASANPSLGHTIQPEYLAQEAAKASGSPAAIATFKRMYLNLRGQQVVRWLDMNRWHACRTRPVRLDDLAGRQCWAGLDLSATTDLTALVLMAWREDGPGLDVWARFWLPRDNMAERVRRDRVPYSLWAEQGWIELTDGEVVDYDAIRLCISGVGPDGTKREPGLADRIDLQALAIDRWNSTQLRIDLEGDGVTVVAFGQGMASMSSPAKELERQVIAGSLNHGANPVLSWMAGCTVVKGDPAGNIKPVKPDRYKSGKRIDGIVALIMAIGAAGEPPKPAVVIPEGYQVMVV